MPKHLVWRYVVSVSKHYSGHISGWLPALLSLGVAVLAAVYISDPSVSLKVVKWTAISYLIVAGLLIFVAQYDAWKEQHQRAHEEAVKNIRPEIEGRIDDFSIGSTNGSSIIEGISYRHTAFSCWLAMTNLRQVPTNITGYALVGVKCSPQIEFRDVVISTPPEVTYAKEVKVRLSGTAQIQGESDTAEDVSLDGLYAIVVDGFRFPHTLPIACSGLDLKFPATRGVRSEDASSAETL
jgi:hypothetical protein